MAATATPTTLTERCRGYERGLGLPVTIRDGQIAMGVGDSAAAVMMPGDLGALVRAAVEERGQRGPIFTHCRSGRWVFITGPDESRSGSQTIPLFRLYVSVISTGYVNLPASDDESDFRRWIFKPGNNSRPPLGEVLDAIHQVGGVR
jgi:hypothetical protein